jgi:hypothetical protein
MSIAFFYNCFHWVVSAENRACWRINEESDPIKVGSLLLRNVYTPTTCILNAHRRIGVGENVNGGHLSP